MTEARRAVVRIASNYVRLFATVCLGLYLIRVLLQTIGEEGVGLFALLGSTVGIVSTIEEAAGWSMIRELGTAHHRGDDAEFRRMYNSAVAVSLVAAAIMMLMFMGLLAILPWLEISAQLQSASRVFILAMGVTSAAMVAMSPAFNMYLITERMVTYNAWMITRRLTMLLAALSLFVLNPQHDPGRGLIIYGLGYCVLQIVAMGLSVAVIAAKDRRLIPNLRCADRAGMKSIIGISGWNVGILLSQVFVAPVGQIIMNRSFGLTLGNLTFGLGTQLSGYLRVFASGITTGLDAVSTRMSVTSDSGSSPMLGLLRTSAQLHALAAFPCLVGLFVMAEPFLHWWIGARVSDPATLSTIATMTRIMAVAFAIMCLSDCWTRVLYGAGFIARFAPVLIASYLATPIVALLLLATMAESHRLYAVAWAIVATHFVFHILVLPVIVARAMHIGLWAVFAPLWRPAVAAAICAPILVFVVRQVPTWNIGWLVAAPLPYCAAFAAVTWLFVMNREERARFRTAFGMLRRRMLSGRA